MDAKSKLTAAQIVAIEAITPEQIFAAYSGKPGCACGCRGNYRYNSKHVEFAQKDRGYAISNNEVNDRQIRKVLLIVQESFVNTGDWTVMIDDAAQWLAVDFENRTYTVYLLPDAAKALVQN